MIIKIRNVSGKMTEYDVELTDTIKQLKLRIEDREGVSPEQQRIVYKAHALNDDQTFEGAQITAGAVLSLVLALRGGQ